MNPSGPSGSTIALAVVGAVVQFVGIVLVASPDLVPGARRAGHRVRTIGAKVERPIRKALGFPPRIITGRVEPLPVEAAQGASVRSGTVNAGAPFELRATRDAADSSYAALVGLVQEAARVRPPFTRMPDRYAMIFLPVNAGLGRGGVGLSGDQIRALAVLVVATPCPLILAAPIALVAGLSRAAASGIVLKGGGALEQLGAAQTVLLDKTGTLTQGRPAVERIVAFDRVSGPSCCAWPPPSISCPRTSWRKGWSTMR